MTARLLSLPGLGRIVLVLAIAIVAARCAIVPETGRSQLVLMPTDYMNSMAVSAYAEETAAYPEITSGPQYEMLQRVGKKIAEAVGKEHDPADFAWEFKLLDAPQVVNAFCLPGGKVAFYTGILKIADNEDQVATVMGHEVAHATALHGNERVSINLVQSGVFTVAGLIAEGWGGLSAQEQEEWMGYAAAIGQYGVTLPFSREHESEADEIGLRYMVRAGYDPYEAPKLWEKMSQLGGGERPAEWESTHPDPANRAARLRELAPKILAEERGGE